jgi:hypothetical protein
MDTNMRKLILSLLLLLLACPNHGAEKLSIDTTRLTFPEALDELQKHIEFTYSLPRTYQKIGSQGSVHFTTSMKLKEDALKVIIEDYSRLHSLVYLRKEKNHYQFVRDKRREYDQGPTLLEALAKLQLFLKVEEIDLRDWHVVQAELKYEDTQGYTGRYWHIQYVRDRGADGGPGIHHFFVYEDMLVEHLKDGNRRGRKKQNTRDIIKSARMPQW